MEVGIVDHVIDPIGPPPPQGGAAGPSQVVGVDVIGMDILRRRQSRASRPQAIGRQGFAA